MEAAGLNRAQLYARWGKPLPQGAAGRLDALIARRAKGEPLAYVLGRQEFFGREFLVDSRVLIPRPETELLVEAAVQWLRSRSAGACPPLGPPVPHQPSALTAADIGTGSGAIAVTLAAEYAPLSLYAIDRSGEALQVAQANAERHDVADRITFLRGDLLEPLPRGADLLLANLPYVASGYLPQWCGAGQTELAWEPLAALDGGDDGLDVIRRFLDRAPAHLRPAGAVLMEIGYAQGPAVRGLAQAAFPSSQVGIRKDLAGHDRLVVIRTPGSDGR